MRRSAALVWLVTDYVVSNFFRTHVMFTSRTIALSALLATVMMQTASVANAMVRGQLVRVPSGSYQPLYGAAKAHRITVDAFRIDRDAVTRAQFLEFVRRNPEWRRSRLSASKANKSGYLRDWQGDLELGNMSLSNAPVTDVSWFAARAYCAEQGKRLPTVDEWEYVAAANANVRDASRDPQFIQQLVSMYLSRSTQLPEVASGSMNAYGVRGMHGVVSEWVEDFNSVLVSDDSRATGGRDHDMFCASAAIGALNTSNYPAFLRFALRAGLNGRSTLSSLGFRCAL